MEEKKSPKANLENKKLMFMQIGMIISLLVAWLAFEHKSYDKREIDPSLLNREIAVDEEMVEIRSGLSEGTLVVWKDTLELADGMGVKVNN